MDFLINSKDAKIHGSFFYNEGKETVILLHGGPGLPFRMKEIIKQLSPHFQVISFQQRGTKNSPCFSGDYSIEKHIGDIEAIADYFKIKNFHLYGHSWGGLYAQWYAEQKPHHVLSLVLCSSCNNSSQEFAEVEKEVRHYHWKKSSLKGMIELSFQTILALMGSTRAYQKMYKKAMINYHKGRNAKEDALYDLVNAEAINNTRKNIFNNTALPSPSSYTQKVTLIYGDDDVFTKSKEKTIARFPQAKTIIIEDCGHFAWLHQEEKHENALKQHFKVFP